MTPAHLIGIAAVLVLPVLAAIVRDREARREAGEVNDQRVSAWRAATPSKETT